MQRFRLSLGMAELVGPPSLLGETFPALIQITLGSVEIGARNCERERGSSARRFDGEEMALDPHRFESGRDLFEVDEGADSQDCKLSGFRSHEAPLLGDLLRHADRRFSSIALLIDFVWLLILKRLNANSTSHVARDFERLKPLALSKTGTIEQWHYRRLALQNSGINVEVL